MDLDDIIDSVVAPSGRGKRGAVVQAQIRRPLTKADVDALWALPEGGLSSVTPPLQRIRFQHHSLARLLAEGRTHQEASLITGFSPSRISILQKDPAFKDLLASYKGMTDEVYVNVHERLAALGMNTIEELQERLDTEPESFSHNELMELSKLTLDRGGYGPASKISHEHSLRVTPDVLARIKSEVGSKQNGTIRSIQSPDRAGTEMGGLIIDGSLGETSAPQGSPGQGDDLPANGGTGTETKVSGR
jgi:hypothetical protein